MILASDKNAVRLLGTLVKRATPLAAKCNFPGFRGKLQSRVSHGGSPFKTLAGRLTPSSQPIDQTPYPACWKDITTVSNSSGSFGGYRPEPPFRIKHRSETNHTSPPQYASAPPVRFVCLHRPELRGGVTVACSLTKGISDSRITQRNLFSSSGFFVDGTTSCVPTEHGASSNCRTPSFGASNRVSSSLAGGSSGDLRVYFERYEPKVEIAMQIPHTPRCFSLIRPLSMPWL